MARFRYIAKITYGDGQEIIVEDFRNPVGRSVFDEADRQLFGTDYSGNGHDFSVELRAERLTCNTEDEENLDEL